MINDFTTHTSYILELFQFLLLQNCLKDADISKSGIHEVILLGSMTRMPKVQDTVEEFFGKKPSRGVTRQDVIRFQRKGTSSCDGNQSNNDGAHRECGGRILLVVFYRHIMSNHHCSSCVVREEQEPTPSQEEPRHGVFQPILVS